MWQNDILCLGNLYDILLCVHLLIYYFFIAYISDAMKTRFARMVLSAYYFVRTWDIAGSEQILVERVNE